MLRVDWHQDLRAEIQTGPEALQEIASSDDVDIVIAAIVGSAGMRSTLAAIEAGKRVALANKETLVVAGQLAMETAARSGAEILPVDSEHSAIFQALQGGRRQDLKQIILTASGGPFRTISAEDMLEVTVDQALAHPTWDMGRKITIDSATMMNKALEIIEARWLFQLDADEIEVVVHPQSIVHSMVEFQDGAVLAQLSPPDMKLPIQYALTYPRHFKTDWEKLDLTKLGKLTFEEPDYIKFPCMRLAFEALKVQGTTPAVLNVANEQAVYRFLNYEIGFNDIPSIIEMACDKHHFIKDPSLDEILNIEKWATDFVKSYKSKTL